MQFASCQELISYICETLNVVWDVPSIVSTKYVPKVNNLSSGRLSSAKIITSAIGFINRADDIPSAYALKKLKEKFAKFATDKDINCTAPFPSDTPLFPNYNDFEECVINFVCGMDLKANRAKLLAVDYAIIDQIIGTKLPAKTSEKAPVVTGAPMDAYSQIFLDIANRFHIAYGSYPTHFRVRVDRISLSDCIDEQKEEAFRNICNFLGGILTFFDSCNLVYEDRQVNFSYEDEIDPFDFTNHKYVIDRVHSTGKWGDPCKIHFTVKASKLCRKFTSCVSQRHMIGVNGLENYAVRINALCSKKFDLLYTRAVPFVFDGFENKSKTQAKTTLTQVCCYLYNRLLMNQQGYNALSSKDKNRVNSVLSISAPFSWKVYDNRCQLIEPGNPIIAEIISNVVSALDDGERHSVYQLFYKFVQAPYGMNENSISLLVSYFIAFQENRYFYFYGTERLMPKHWSTDKGKLKVPEFKKINIQKNANAGIDLVAELCEKIMSNTDISNCANLKNSLTMLVAQEGETESNQYKIGQAITYLDAGIRLERNFTDQLRKAQNHIEDLKKQFRILSFVKIFDLIPRISDPIEDGLEYVYTEKQKNDVLKLKAIVEQMLPKLYLPMLSALDFKFEELSENQKRYRHAAEILRANKYEDYADATENRLTEIEKSLRAKQKYESSLVECERDLTQSKNLFKLADCEEMEAKLNGWVEFFSKTNELPTDIIAPLNKRIKNAKNELCQKKAELLNEYTAAIDNASTAETVIQLRQSISKISMLMQMQLGPDSEQTLLKVQSDIDDAIHQIETLPQNLDNLKQFIYSLNHMQHRCLKAIKHGATALQADLIQKQAIWVKRYIEEAERSYKSMSAIECQNWLDKTASHPIYLQAPIIERLNRTRELVESQLHSCRVDGLLAMYDKLSESEKQTFKKLLLAR